MTATSTSHLVGAAVWAVVLAGLLTLAGLTWRGMRRGDRPQRLEMLPSIAVVQSHGTSIDAGLIGLAGSVAMLLFVRSNYVQVRVRRMFGDGKFGSAILAFGLAIAVVGFLLTVALPLLAIFAPHVLGNTPR